MNIFIFLCLIKHAVRPKSCYFMVLNTLTEPIRKKSNRGYENRNRTEPWKSWTVPALDIVKFPNFDLPGTHPITTMGLWRTLDISDLAFTQRRFNLLIVGDTHAHSSPPGRFDSATYLSWVLWATSYTMVGFVIIITLVWFFQCVTPCKNKGG